jgi:hypothetical protein
MGRTIGVLGTAKGQWPLASNRGNRLLIKLDFLPGKGSSAATRPPSRPPNNSGPTRKVKLLE